MANVVPTSGFITALEENEAEVVAQIETLSLGAAKAWFPTSLPQSLAGLRDSDIYRHCNLDRSVGHFVGGVALGVGLCFVVIMILSIKLRKTQRALAWSEKSDNNFKADLAWMARKMRSKVSFGEKISRQVTQAILLGEERKFGEEKKSSEDGGAGFSGHASEKANSPKMNSPKMNHLKVNSPTDSKYESGWTTAREGALQHV